MTEEERLNILRMLTQGGNVKISQLSVGDHNTLNNYEGVEENVEKEKKEITDAQLACAIESCQEYFWGNSAYAVVYCFCRDDCGMRLTYTDFEDMVEVLPYKKEVRKCPAGTIANAFSDNPIFNENIVDWGNFNPMARIIKLRDGLRNALKL